MRIAEIQSALYLPCSFTVLGTRLLPFTLGHALAMEALDLRTIESLGQLAMAVLVCSRPSGSVQRDWGSFRQGGTIRWRAFRVQCRMFWLHLRKGPFDVIRWASGEIAAFQRYCEYYNESVKFEPIARSVADSDEVSIGCPFLEHLVVVLVSKLNFTEASAMELPMNIALMRYIAWMESEGRIKIVSDEEYEQKQAEQAALLFESDEMHQQRLAIANSLK